MKHVKKFNESATNIDVYVVLHWFWEGDSYLVNKYMDCFINELDANSFANKEANNKNYKEPLKIYKNGEDIPDEEDGHYDSPSFIEVIKKSF